MKPNKALRRLVKIEASMSDVVERFSTNAPSIRKALQDAMAAVTVAKEAVNLEATSGMVRNPPLEQSPLKKAAEGTKSVPAKKATSKKAGPAKVVAKKVGSAKKTVVKTKAQKTAPAPAQVEAAS